MPWRVRKQLSAALYWWFSVYNDCYDALKPHFCTLHRETFSWMLCCSGRVQEDAGGVLSILKLRSRLHETPWPWEIRPTEQQNLNLLKPTYMVNNVESRKSRKINQPGWSNCAFDTDWENGLFSWVVGLVGGRFTQHNWSRNKFATYQSRTARWIWSSLLLVPHRKQMECISQICSYPLSSTSESRSEKHRPPTLPTL